MSHLGGHKTKITKRVYRNQKNGSIFHQSDVKGPSSACQRCSRIQNAVLLQSLSINKSSRDLLKWSRFFETCCDSAKLLSHSFYVPPTNNQYCCFFMLRSHKTLFPVVSFKVLGAHRTNNSPGKRTACEI